MKRRPISHSLLSCGLVFFATSCALFEPTAPELTPKENARLRSLEGFQPESVAAGPAETKQQAMQRQFGKPLDQLPIPQYRFESEPIALERVREILLQNNLNLQISRLSQESAAQGVFAALGAFQPTVSGAVNLTDTDSSTTVGTDTARSRTDTISGSAGVSVPLLIGGSLDLAYDVSDSRTGITDLSGGGLGIPNTDSATATPSVSLTVPLLRGAGQRIAQSGITIAAYQSQAATARFRNLLQATLVQAEQTYWNLYQSFLTLEIQVEQLDQFDKQLQIGRELLDARERTQADVQRLQLAYNNQRQSVIEANRSLRVTVRSLLGLLQSVDYPLNLDGQKLLRPATEPSVLFRQLNGAKLETLAIQNRSELLEDQYNIAASKLQWDVARNQRLPSLSVILGASAPGLSGNDPGLRGAISNSGAISSDPAFSAGIILSTPLGRNRSAYARAEQAYLDYLSQLATYEGRLITIKQAVHNAVDELNAAWAQVLQQAHNLQLAQASYELETRLFQQGLASSNDMIDALVNLTTGRLNELNAIVRYQQALIGLATATGTVPQHAGVTLADVPNQNERLNRRTISGAGD